jgi:hypothetical protein
MAKDPIDLAGFDAENTGGLLSGFLADEDEFDRRSLWRLGSWGLAAVTAVIVSLMANQSSIVSRHDQVAAADLARQSQQIQTVAKDSQNETRRLASAIDTLNGDRDRLYSRLTVLEHGLDSVTGTVARQGPAAAPPEAVQTPNPAPSPTATTSSLAASPAAPSPSTPSPSMPSPAMPTSAMPAPVPVAEEPSPPVQNPPSPPPSPPVMSPVATTPAATAEKTLSNAAVADPGPATVASVAPTAPTASAASTVSATSQTTARTASQTTARPNTPRAPKAITARPNNYATAKPPVVHFIQPEKPPSLIATAPMPEVVASAQPAIATAAKTEPDPLQTIPQAAIQRTEFGVDLGGANSVNGLRALWRGLIKSRSNASLAALQPIIVIKESNIGLGMQLRLVAGPFSDAAEAAKICAIMAERERPCETAVFDGQRLVMKVDEPSAASTPVAAADKPSETAKPAVHRHVSAKHVTPEEPPPPQPAEPPPLSFFGMRLGSGQ